MTTVKSSFVSLGRLKRATTNPGAALEQIRTIYFRTTRETVEHDLEEALDLLKSLPDEAARERATVFMHGLNEMRREWQRSGKVASKKRPVKKTGARRAETASTRRRS